MIEEQQITKDEHFVPVFYLSNFVKPQGMLQAYNIQKRIFFPAHPEDVCYKRFLYESLKVGNPREKNDFIAVNDKLGDISTVLDALITKSQTILEGGTES